MRVSRDGASQLSRRSALLLAAGTIVVLVLAGLLIDAMDDGEASVDLVPLAVAVLLALFAWHGRRRDGGGAP